jgi:TRAP-type C4-dicarboxylate transport system substrate-binding protein
MMASMGAALATPALLSRANAAEVTLRLSHFLPGVAPIQTKFFEPWAAELKEASNGAIDVQIFPSLQLGGKPPQLADQTRQGIVDIAWTLPVYTPDRFPIAETMALPFMVTNAEKTSVVMHKLMDEFAQGEYDGMKVLAYHTHDGGKLHTRNAPVTSQADLKGDRNGRGSVERRDRWLLPALRSGSRVQTARADQVHLDARSGRTWSLCQHLLAGHESAQVRRHVG